MMTGDPYRNLDTDDTLSDKFEGFPQPGKYDIQPGRAPHGTTYGPLLTTQQAARFLGVPSITLTNWRVYNAGPRYVCYPPVDPADDCRPDLRSGQKKEAPPRSDAEGSGGLNRYAYRETDLLDYIELHLAAHETRLATTTLRYANRKMEYERAVTGSTIIHDDERDTWRRALHLIRHAKTLDAAVSIATHALNETAPEDIR